MVGGMVSGGGSSTSYSYSSSSSSGGAISGGGISGGAISGGVSGGSLGVSSGGLHGSGISVGGGSASGTYAIARKTNISKSSGASAAGNSMMMALSALGGGSSSYAGTHELSENPKSVILRRGREKTDISALNVKLADYIHSNGMYRVRVQELEKVILGFKEKFEAIEPRLRAMYDAEMLQLRGIIDATAKEKAVVELKVETLEGLYKEFRLKYEAELGAHETTKARLPRLEKEVSEKDAQIDYLAKTLSSLEPQVASLKTQISTYQKQAIEAKMAGDASMAGKVELESKVQSATEEIAFLRKTYDEKLRLALDFDFDTGASYSNELAEALKDIRAEYQAQLEAISGAEDDGWVQNQIGSLLATSDKQRGELQMARDELAKAKAAYNSVISSTSKYEGEILALQAQMAQMTADFENERKLHAVAIDDRDKSVAEYKKLCAAYVLELKGLIDVKLSLDEEIGTYRRLLLAGGSEVKITGATTVVGGGSTVVGGGSTVVGGGSTLTQSSTSSQIVSGGSQIVSGSSQVVSGGAASTAMVSQSMAKTTFSAMTKGPVAIVETSPDGRFIKLENKSGAAVNLGGWSLVRSVDMGEELKFSFAAGTSLAAFASLTLWASGVAGAVSDATNIIWSGAKSWGMGFNATNDLRDAAGDVTASLTQKTLLS